jgi:hypothetical protein
MILGDFHYTAVRRCLDGWWRHGSSCYYFSDTLGNITDALVSCLALFELMSSFHVFI